MVRNAEKAAQVFGSRSDDKLEVSDPFVPSHIRFVASIERHQNSALARRCLLCLRSEQVVTADLRDAAAVKGLFDGCDAVCSSTGTTAFPSKR